MGITNYLGLNIPDKNSKGRVVTDVFEPNFTKIDQNAEETSLELSAHTKRTDNPHKVTKAQVGLSEVQNYPVTSAVNDASNAKYATAGAVKTVQDNANGRVSKTGDIMTGTLQIDTAWPAVRLTSTEPTDAKRKVIRLENYRGGGLKIFSYESDVQNKTAALSWDGLVGGDVYHTGNKPTASDVGLGNVSNVAQVTDVRMSGNTQVVTWDKAVNTYASGRVITGVGKDTNSNNIDFVYYANLQKCVNGTWYTVATS